MLYTHAKCILRRDEPCDVTQTTSKQHLHSGIQMSRKQRSRGSMGICLLPNLLCTCLFLRIERGTLHITHLRFLTGGGGGTGVCRGRGGRRVADVGFGRLGVFHLAPFVLGSQPAELRGQSCGQDLLLGELHLKEDLCQKILYNSMLLKREF